MKTFEKIYSFVLSLLIVCVMSAAGVYIYNEHKKIQKNKRIFLVESNKVDGIVFGKKGHKYYISPTKDEGHVFVCGGTGEGKTSALLIPTLRAWKGNSFVIDISGDIHTNVHRSNNVIFNPIAENNRPYNVFELVDEQENDSQKFRELKKIAFVLMPDVPGASSDDKFYNTEGRKILIAAMYVYYLQGRDFCEICELILTQDVLELLSLIYEIGDWRAKRLVKGFRGIKESTASSCKQACNEAVELFGTDENIMRNLRRPKPWEKGISPKTMEVSNLYLVIPEDKIEILSALMHLVTDQAMKYMLSRPTGNKTKILFALDEFASLGNIDILPCLRRARKHHIRLMVCTQSMADLDIVYGLQVRKAMMSNFAFSAILLATDVETQEYFSKLAGCETDDYGTRERRIDPEEFGELEDELILLGKSFHARIERNYYFVDDEKKRAHFKDILTELDDAVHETIDGVKGEARLTAYGEVVYVQPRLTAFGEANYVESE